MTQSHGLHGNPLNSYANSRPLLINNTIAIGKGHHYLTVALDLDLGKVLESAVESMST